MLEIVSPDVSATFSYHVVCILSKFPDIVSNFESVRNELIKLNIVDDVFVQREYNSLKLIIKNCKLRRFVKSILQSKYHTCPIAMILLTCLCKNRKFRFKNLPKIEEENAIIEIEFIE